MDKAYKFRIYPTPDQETLIHKTFGSCRAVFNHFLAKRIEAYSTDKKSITHNVCSAQLTVLKSELTWLREVDSTALQSSLKDLDTAYQNFFRRVRNGEKPGFPKWKRRHDPHKSYRAKQNGSSIAVTETTVKLPKLGHVSAAISQPIQGRILNATVSQVPSGKYYVSICCTDVDIPQYKSTGAIVGIDLGLKTLAVTSDGQEFENPRHLKRSTAKLVREQWRLSRKPKGSNNRNKQRIKVARVHERVKNQRLDSIHKMTTQLVKDYDVICIEDLNVKGMVRNHSLAKSVSDAAWGETRRQLTYKTAWQHKVLVVTSRWFPSSQLCGCGYKNADVKDLSVRYWTCPNCGAEHDRDKNAADNIRDEGLRILHVA